MERDFLSLACLAGGVAHGWGRGNGGQLIRSFFFSQSNQTEQYVFSRPRNLLKSVQRQTLINTLSYLETGWNLLPNQIIEKQSEEAF